MRPLDPRIFLNGAALILAAVLAVLMIFQAVPSANAQLVGVIVGGIIGFLTGASSPRPPQQ